MHNQHLPIFSPYCIPLEKKPIEQPNKLHINYVHPNHQIELIKSVEIIGKGEHLTKNDCIVVNAYLWYNDVTRYHLSTTYSACHHYNTDYGYALLSHVFLLL